MKHVLAHETSNSGKPLHTVFKVRFRGESLYLVDEAWLKKGLPEVGDPLAYIVPMGRVVGTNGETKIRLIVTLPGTNWIATAYPVL